MLKNLVLVAGTAIFAVGCAEMSQNETPETPEISAAVDASEMSAVTEAPEVPAVAKAPSVPDAAEAPEVPDAENTLAISAVRTGGDSLTITIVNDGSDTMGTTETTAVLITQPSLSHEPVYMTSETTANMNLPFSDAVRVGHLLFLSGQIGNVSGTTELVPGGIQAETRQTMEKIKTILEANGSSLERVVKATVMLADIAEWPAFNEVYVTYFPGNKPARSAFAGSGLAFGARCEVEVIATVGE